LNSDEDYLRRVLDATSVLSMTVCFHPSPRIAEIRYQDADGRLSSTMEESDGSYEHWYGRGGSSNNLTEDEVDFDSLSGFALKLYQRAQDLNDPRFWSKPVLLSMTIDFTNTRRIAEITYLERDGRITTASGCLLEFMFDFQYSHGGWKRVRQQSDIDFAALLRLARSLYEAAFRDRLCDDAE
jgi:hypothetical protein